MSILAHQNYFLCRKPTIFWKCCWLVFRPYGVRSASPRFTFYLRRSKRSPYAKNMNLKIKFRESFRPFAPAVLQDYASSIFEGCSASPYMLFTYQVLSPDSKYALSGLHSLPAITHVDHSARVQTVSAVNSPSLYRLLSAFFDQTGCPVLINTSFNLRGEPIVCTPYDAFDCFMRSHIDILVLDGFVIKKSDQSKNLSSLYSTGSTILD